MSARASGGRIAAFPEEVLGPIKDAQKFNGSIGFRESIVTQIRKTNPTVREYLKQTRYTGSGHAGFVGTPEQLADHIEDLLAQTRHPAGRASA